VTFVGFPAGGVAAGLVAGPVDSTFSAVLGGLVAGAVLGAVQAWGFGAVRPPVAQWIGATAMGLAAGLGVGSSAVGFGTDLPDLVVMGAVSGAWVGMAQALVLRPRLGRAALAWPVLLGVLWAAAWAISTSIGVDVERQYASFGSSGAVVVAAVTAVLPIRLARTKAATKAAAS
jgi:hypothetical protein